MLEGSCATEVLHVFAAPRSEWFFRLTNFGPALFKTSSAPVHYVVLNVLLLFDFFFLPFWFWKWVKGFVDLSPN